MSLGSQILSFRSNLADSLSIVQSNCGLGASSDPVEKITKPVPLFDFLRVASASGLRQYAQDFAEQGLMSARLGNGADYIVDKVKSRDGQIVVVKHVKAIASLDIGVTRPSSDESSQIRKVLREIKIATHPALKENANILQMKGFGWELAEGSLAIPFLVVEYAEHGTLRSYLQNNRGSVGVEAKLDLAFGAAKGLQALHSNRIAHGDLKLENALVVSSASEHAALKITDFGLSVVLEDDAGLYEYLGTLCYRPPEVCQQAGDSSAAGLITGSSYRACDIYTYGLLLLEILINGERYFGLAGQQVQLEERSAALQCLLQVADQNSVVLATIKSMVESCLHAEAGERPQIQEIVSRFGDVKGDGEMLGDQDVSPFTFSELSREESDGIVNMNQLFATLVGHELDDGFVHVAPWNIQELIAEGLRERTTLPNYKIASQACLELGICHYLGFGVDRDQRKVLQYMDQAAIKGSFEARRIRHRLHEAFSETMEPLNVQVELDDQEELQLQRILLAESAHREVNPFQVFDEVVQEDFRLQMGDEELTLHQAAYIGDLGLIREILKSTRDFQDDRGRTALFLAVQGGHLDAMEMLLELGDSDPSISDYDGHTALHMLVMLKITEVEAALSLMLRFYPGLNLDVFSSSILDASEHWCELWGAPLHWAVLAGNRAMTLCLVRSGVRVHDWPEDLCPIRIAVSLHLSDILEILLAAIPTKGFFQGGNMLLALNSSNPFRRLLLHGNNYVSEIERTITLLTSTYSSVVVGNSLIKGNPLRNILIHNFSDSDYYIAKALVAVGTYKDDNEGWTLLQSAILGCRGSPLSSVCRMALDMIDISQHFRLRSTDYKKGWMALHWVAAGGTVPVAKMLLQIDPDSINVRTQEEEERTPLHLAAEAGKSIAMVKLLLDRGADASLTTSGLKLTPLGTFISNGRSELNIDILTALLQASKRTGYLAFSSDNWNVLHYAAARAAILDSESLPGHVLLRTLASMQEMKSLIESTTAQGWTPLHLASYFIDCTTIRVLVEEMNADVRAQTPNNATAFDIVMERARRFPDSLRGADSFARWSRQAYRSALFLQLKLEETQGSYHLTPLHVAAYMGYHVEVTKLINKDPNSVFETNWEGKTPLQMLQNTMPTHIDAKWAQRFCRLAERVCELLMVAENERHRR
uniref:Protein kinase domain-containing protein n=1 Tax=Coccidioides posadasii RMSCC 3488 TaxID=454284 RepID=A0A0J6FE12_COCPO|nr:hypothetical protein CPAG_03864 [Coccidioides posadasii RMSCC 3488]